MTHVSMGIAAIFAAIAANACAHPVVVDGRYRDAHAAYSVGAPGQGWRAVELPPANGAWYNDALQASLLVNSHCEGVADAPLESLTNDLLMGTTERVFVTQERLPWSKREALESTVHVKLDGVARTLRTFVLKKDRCVYDIVLDVPGDTLDAALAGYVRVRDAFDVGARPDSGS